MSRRSAALPIVNGLDEMLTNTSVPAAARSAIGSRGYSCRAQNVASFQTSSQTVTPRRTPLNVMGVVDVPGSK